MLLINNNMFLNKKTTHRMKKGAPFLGFHYLNFDNSFYFNFSLSLSLREKKEILFLLSLGLCPMIILTKGIYLYNIILIHSFYL